MYLAAAGIALKVMGTIADANSQAGQFKAQSAADASNANILDQRALQIGAEGARNEEQIRREGRQVVGSQIAAAGEGGFNDTGSPMDLVRQSVTMNELDALNVRYQAANESRGYRTEAGNARTSSILNRKLASRAKTSGYLSALGTAAMGASGMGGGGGGGFAAGGKGLYTMNYSGAGATRVA